MALSGTAKTRRLSGIHYTGSTFSHNYQFAELRKFIFTNCELTHIITGVKFEEVKSDNLMFILKKTKPKSDSIISIKHLSESNFESVNQSYIFENEKYKYIFVKSETRNIIEKIENHPSVTKLFSLFDTGVGFIGIKKQILSNQISTCQSKIITGRDITKNKIKKYRYFDFININLLGGTTNISRLSSKPKIVLRKTGDRLTSALEMKGLLPEQSLYFIISRNNSLTDLLFLNRLLNSNLMNFYYLNMAITNINSTPQLKKRDLDNFPVLSSDHIFNSTLIPTSTADNEPANSLKRKILSISEQEIYKIFNISSDEQKIIESFFHTK